MSHHTKELAGPRKEKTDMDDAIKGKNLNNRGGNQGFLEDYPHDKHKKMQGDNTPHNPRIRRK